MIYDEENIMKDEIVKKIIDDGDVITYDSKVVYVVLIISIVIISALVCATILMYQNAKYEYSLMNDHAGYWHVNREEDNRKKRLREYVKLQKEIQELEKKSRKLKRKKK